MLTDLQAESLPFTLFVTLIGGVIHGFELKGYSIILTYHSIYTEMNIANNDIDPVILVTIKDVSACQGTLVLYDASSNRCGALEGCYIEVLNV